ncbi:hypothetical protein DID77_00065 [Candidatus Marinamargulisbacteria bacterium SCGC AG-439-L15]|nr:hypothetical protein DID77_00065 [Candidatus Marinamargulisbacteria bacterium SCGC AG-439-L15]
MVKKEKQLIGFYRKNKKIEPIYSESNEFVDTYLLKYRCEAKIVPLECIDNPIPWTLSDVYESVSGPLKALLDANQILCVSKSDKKSGWYALMYAPKEMPEMARLGVLLRKEKNAYVPVTVTVNGYEYIVELKGVGSPQGMFPGYHQRLQSGTRDRFHLRVTGGLSPEGAIKEYENLHMLRQLDHKVPKGQTLYGLGVNLFSLTIKKEDFPLGQVLRLSPSTIRAGFTENPAFDALQDKKDYATFINTIGFEVAKFLSLEIPMVHRNISFNNLVYVSKKAYVLSDFEELAFAHQGHCNLEVKDCLYSPYLNMYPFRFLFNDNFINGFSSFKEGAHKIKDPAMSAQDLNRQLLQGELGATIFQDRLESGVSTAFLEENSRAIKSFMPDSYYQKPLLKWIKTDLLPNLTHQESILQLFIEYATENGIETLWHHVYDAPNNASTLWKAISACDPDIAKRLKTNEDAVNFGDYTTDNHCLLFFLKRTKTLFELKRHSVQLKSNIMQLSQILTTKKMRVKQEYVTSFMALKESVSFFDFHLLACPFIGFLSVFYENESLLLKGAEKNKRFLSRGARKTLKETLSFIKDRQCTLQKNPEKFHQKLRQSDAVFLKYITPAYFLK